MSITENQAEVKFPPHNKRMERLADAIRKHAHNQKEISSSQAVATKSFATKPFDKGKFKARIFQSNPSNVTAK